MIDQTVSQLSVRIAAGAGHANGRPRAAAAAPNVPAVAVGWKPRA